MSDGATHTDIKRAVKYVKGLAKTAENSERSFHLELAGEALESVERNYNNLARNWKAEKLVQKLYQAAAVAEGRLWDYVLRLLEEDRIRRGR